MKIILIFAAACAALAFASVNARAELQEKTRDVRRVEGDLQSRSAGWLRREPCISGAAHIYRGSANAGYLNKHCSDRLAEGSGATRLHHRRARIAQRTVVLRRR